MARRGNPEASILEVLLPFLDACEAAYMARSAQAGSDVEASLPHTADGKINVEGLVAELFRLDPLRIRRADAQHFHNNPNLSAPVNETAARMGLKPIGSRVLSPGERADKAVLAKAKSSEKRASDDNVALRSKVEELTRDLERVTAQRDRYRSIVHQIYENGDIPGEVVKEVLRASRS